MSTKRVRFSELDPDSSSSRIEPALDDTEGELKRKWQKWTGPNAPPGEGPPDAPAYGELNYSSVKKILDHLETNCGLGTENNNFFDVGHGRGIVALTVAHRFPSVTALGIEIDKYRYDISVEYKKRAGALNCHFLCNDFCHYIKWCNKFPDTNIVYTFDRGFERTPGEGVMHAMAMAWNRDDTSARWLVSFRTPNEWTKMGLLHFEMVTKISRLRSRGSHSSFTAYIYKRI